MKGTRNYSPFGNWDRLTIVIVLLLWFLISLGFSSEIDITGQNEEPERQQQQQQQEEDLRQLMMLHRLLVPKVSRDQSDDRYRSDTLWLHQSVKRGPGDCINSCLLGGMAFVRCKSMCHWDLRCTSQRHRSTDKFAFHGFSIRYYLFTVANVQEMLFHWAE